MTPTIYARESLWPEDENRAAVAAGFRVVFSVLDLGAGDVVIPRYSMLPFYQDQVRDIERSGARIINSWNQHRYVADFMRWYPDLIGETPVSWPRPSDVPTNHPGPFVLKGGTNSRKGQWFTHMYARDRAGMLAVATRLQDDSLIGDQGVVVREFVWFDALMTQVNGMPVAREFRVFVLGTRVMGAGWYWSSVTEDMTDMGIEIPSPNEIPRDWFMKVVAATTSCPFRVIDVAQTMTGEWMVVELNDGQMSGLSDVNPDELYGNLYQALLEDG